MSNIDLVVDSRDIEFFKKTFEDNCAEPLSDDTIEMLVPYFRMVMENVEQEAKKDRYDERYEEGYDAGYEDGCNT